MVCVKPTNRGGPVKEYDVSNCENQARGSTLNGGGASPVFKAKSFPWIVMYCGANAHVEQVKQQPVESVCLLVMRADEALMRVGWERSEVSHEITARAFIDDRPDFLPLTYGRWLVLLHLFPCSWLPVD